MKIYHIAKVAVTALLLLVRFTSAVDYHGTVFYTGFPKNSLTPIISSPRLHITTSEAEPVNFTVHTAVESRSYTVQPGQTTTVNIQSPSSIIVTSSEQLDRSIRVHTEGNKTIAVYASNNVVSSAGAFAVLPLHRYQNITNYTYYAVSSDTDLAGQGSTILLINGNEPNIITVTPTQSVTIPGVVTGLATDVTVQAEESYQFNLSSNASFLLRSAEDLTGSKIVSTLPLATITGHECGNIPTETGQCDHMIQQIPPTITWGRVHMSLPLAERTSGSTFKIIAAANDTNIVVSCTDGSNPVVTNYTLNEGNFIVHSEPADIRCSFVANGGILVTQFAEGGLYEGLGDPMSMSLTPLEQYTNVSTIVVPTSTFLSTSADTIKNMLHIFVAANDSGINVTVDGTAIAMDSWMPIYGNGDTLLGYGASVNDLSSEYHVIRSNETLLMSVLVYGFTSENHAYGYPLNTALNNILVEPFTFNFSMANYTILEGAEHLIPLLRLNELNEETAVHIQGCNDSPLPDNVMIINSDIEFSRGQHSRNVHLTIFDDKELSAVKCFCLEAVNSKQQQLYPYFKPFSTTNICITDNEDVRLDVTNAEVIENENGKRYLELKLSISGFEGETDMKISIQPTIQTINNNLQQNNKRSTNSQLSSFNVYFTKFLTSSTYLLELSADQVISSSSSVAIETFGNSLNINSTIDPLEIVVPVEQTTVVPTPSQQPPMILTTTHTITLTETRQITFTNTPFTNTPSPLIPTATVSSVFVFIADNSHTFFYVFVVLVTVFIVLLVSNFIICGLYIRQRKMCQVDLPPSPEPPKDTNTMHQHTQQTQFTEGLSPIHNRLETHHLNTPHHCIRSTTESPTPSPRSSDGSTYSDTLPRKIMPNNNLRQKRASDDMSSVNSFSGSDRIGSCDLLYVQSQV